MDASVTVSEIDISDQVVIERKVDHYSFQKKRGYWAWFRRWLRTSKPTEWMTASAQLMAVVGAIITGIIYLSSGILDKKKSETEAKIALLKVDEARLEEGNEELLLAQERLKIEGAALRKENEEARSKLDLAQKDLADYRQILAKLAEVGRQFVSTEHQYMDLQNSLLEMAMAKDDITRTGILEKSTEILKTRRNSSSVVTALLKEMNERLELLNGRVNSQALK